MILLKLFLWEQKVLKKLDVENNEIFLNKKNCTTKTIIINPNITSFKKGYIPWNKGKKYDNLTIEERKEKFGRFFSLEEKKKLSDLGKLLYINEPERREIARLKNKEQFLDPIKRKKHKDSCFGHLGSIWINNGVINKRVKKDQLEEFINLGFYKGRICNFKFWEHGNRKRDSVTGKFI